MYIVDVVPPETHLTIKMVDMPDLGECVKVSGKFAYVGSYRAIQIVDISSIPIAHRETSVSVTGFSYNVDVQNGYIFSAGDSGLEIFTPYIPASGGLMNYTIPEYATYQVFTATVVDG